MADAFDRSANAQNLYREVNERVAEVHTRLHEEGWPRDRPVELLEIFCECGHSGTCVPAASTSAPETYERVRADPTALFLLLPGHGEASAENVIEHGDGYFIARTRTSSRPRQSG